MKIDSVKSPEVASIEGLQVRHSWVSKKTRDRNGIVEQRITLMFFYKFLVDYLLS